MSRIVSLALGLGWTASFVFAAEPAWAQRNQIPSLTLPTFEERQQILDLSETPDFEPFSFENRYMDDRVRLQYQISLLSHLIDREASVQSIRTAYADLGLTYNAPPPPRDICAFVPANLVCHAGHPGLYATTPGGVPLPNPLDITEGVLAFVPQAPVPVRIPEPEKPKVTTDFTWAEIRCLSGLCSAVVADGQNARARRTVSVGDVLEDSAEITEISAAGVTVLKEGVTLALVPSNAPARGGPASPLYARGDEILVSLDRAREERTEAPDPRGMGDTSESDPSTPTHAAQRHPHSRTSPQSPFAGLDSEPVIAPTPSELPL